MRGFSLAIVNLVAPELGSLSLNPSFWGNVTAGVVVFPVRPLACRGRWPGGAIGLCVFTIVTSCCVFVLLVVVVIAAAGTCVGVVFEPKHCRSCRCWDVMIKEEAIPCPRLPSGDDVTYCMLFSMLVSFGPSRFWKSCSGSSGGGTSVC